jgi:hypothetical protein
VVWAPTEGSVSREFAINNHLVALGTGGTGKSTLAEEMQAAMKMGMPAEAVYSMVTTRPASVLLLRNGEGRIVAEHPADMLVINDVGLSPAQALSTLAHTPVSVIVGGRPMLVSNALLDRVPEPMREPLRSFTVGDSQWWAEEHTVAAVRGARRSGQRINISGQAVKV